MLIEITIYSNKKACVLIIFDITFDSTHILLRYYGYLGRKKNSLKNKLEK